MTTPDLDPTAYPILMGVERPFFDFWNSHILREDDPHRQRWIDYEEGAVSRAGGQQSRGAEPSSRTLYGSGVGTRVLDVGCQNGAWFVALGRAGATPTGIDVDASALEAARITTAAYGIEARVEVASACEMPFASHSFDVVASADVLEHVLTRSRCSTNASACYVQAATCSYMTDPVQPQTCAE